MQPININFSYQNNHSKPATVDINKLPATSLVTESIFSNAGFKAPDSNSLHARIRDLKDTTRLLEEAQKNSKRDKILAIVATALSVAFFALAVFALAGGMGYNPASEFFGYIGIISYFFVQMFANAHFINSYSKRDPSDGFNLGVLAALCPLIGPFVPVWQAFRKIPQLKEEEHSQKLHLSLALNHAIPSLKDYYKKHGAALTQKIGAELTDARDNLTAMQQFKVRVPSGEDQVKIRISDLEKAQSELKTAVQFYTKTKFTI